MGVRNDNTVHDIYNIQDLLGSSGPKVLLGTLWLIFCIILMQGIGWSTHTTQGWYMAY